MKKKRFPIDGAFTLVELMVVIVIIGILATTVAWRLWGYVNEAKVKKAMLDIKQISEGLELWRLDHDRYPTAQEGLEVLAERTEKHPDGIMSEIPLDPWGNEYQYKIPGTYGSYDLICYGRDGKEGGEGWDVDIVSWDLSRRGRQ